MYKKLYESTTQSMYELVTGGAPMSDSEYNYVMKHECDK